MRQLLWLSHLLFFLPPAAWSAVPNHWDLGLGVGVSFPELTSSEVSPGIGWPDDTHTNKDTDAAGLLTAYAGYTIENDTLWLPAYSIGLQYLYSAPSEITGHVQQYSLSEFENYEYDYEIQTQALFAVLKMELYRYKIFAPFVSGGIGAAWNQLNDYHEVALAGITPRINPAFADNTQSNFAFILGAGLDVRLSESLNLAMEYNFGDFGDIESDISTVYIDETLSSDLTANMLLLNLRYALQ